jgi:predicted RNase H-like HicB family nuclease
LQSSQNQFDMKIETELEEDGRWIAEVMDHPGAIAYGATKEEAIKNAVRIVQETEEPPREVTLEFVERILAAGKTICPVCGKHYLEHKLVKEALK